MARSIDLSDAFRRCHERLDYEDVRRGPTSGALQAAVEAHLRSTFARLWRKDWHIIVHGSASTGTTEEPHHHIFASIEDRNGLRIIPGLDQKTMVTSRKLGGFIIHIDETPQTGVLPSLRTALGLSRGTHLESSIEALMIHPRVMAAEVERLVNRPGESIFDGACRSLIALDLEKRGKSSPIGEITFGPFAAWAHPASKIPLRAIIAAHHHGRHLISFALDERYGVIRPESDIRIEGFFPT
jgi:hypothetical protein